MIISFIFSTLILSLQISLNQSQCFDRCSLFKQIEICSSQIYQCENNCKQISLHLDERDQIQCLNKCQLNQLQDNLTPETIHYLNCLNECQSLPLLDVHEINKRILELQNNEQLRIQFKQDREAVNSRLNGRVAFLDYAYYKRDSAEKLVVEFFRSKKMQIKYVNENFHNPKFYVSFCFRPEKINYQIFQEGKQLTNHIEGVMALSDKHQLVLTLRDLDNQKIYNYYNSSNFFAKTFLLDLSHNSYTDEESDVFQLKFPTWYIVKPAVGHGGEGIRLVKNVTHFQEHFLNKKQKQRRKASNKPKYILQEYMIDPLLLDNKKFDLRYFCVRKSLQQSFLKIIPSVQPFAAFLFRGFIRKSLFDYEIDNQDENDDFRHITNVAMQRQHPDYEKLKDESIWLFDKFDQYILKSHTSDQVEQMYCDMKKAITYTLQAGKQKFNLKKGFYQVLTFDFMVSKNLKPLLIEVNRSPSWATSNPIYVEMKNKLFNSIHDLVFLLHEDTTKTDLYLKNLDKLDIDLSDFEVLINEATGQEFLLDN